MDTKPGEMSTSDSSLALPKPISSTAKLLFATNGLASNPAKHLGILNLKVLYSVSIYKKHLCILRQGENLEKFKKHDRLRRLVKKGKYKK